MRVAGSQARRLRAKQADRPSHEPRNSGRESAPIICRSVQADSRRLLQFMVRAQFFISDLEALSLHEPKEPGLFLICDLRFESCAPISRLMDPMCVRFLKVGALHEPKEPDRGHAGRSSFCTTEVRHCSNGDEEHRNCCGQDGRGPILSRFMAPIRVISFDIFTLSTNRILLRVTDPRSGARLSEAQQVGD